MKDDMCGREVRRAVWEGEEWRKRENGGGLEEEGTGEDEEWRRARRMKGAEEGSGGASLGLRQSHCDRDAFARVGKHRVAWMCCRNER